MQTDPVAAISNAFQKEPLQYSYIDNETMRVYATASNLYYLPNRKIYFRNCRSQNLNSDEPEYLFRIAACVRESFEPEKLMGELISGASYNPDIWGRAVPIIESEVPVELADRIQKIVIAQNALIFKQKKLEPMKGVIQQTWFNLLSQVPLDNEEALKKMVEEYTEEKQKGAFQQEFVKVLCLESMQTLLLLKSLPLDLPHDNPEIECAYREICTKIDEIKNTLEQAGSNILPSEWIETHAESLLSLCRSFSEKETSGAHNALMQSYQEAIDSFKKRYNQLLPAEHLVKLVLSATEMAFDPMSDKIKAAQLAVGEEFARLGGM